MIKFIFLILMATLYLNAELSNTDIENMVMKIHKKREGIELNALENTQEPFVYVKQDTNVTKAPPKAEEELILNGIMNGRAFINNHWYKVNDSVLGYTLKYIGKNGVVLRNVNHIKKVFLNTKKKNCIILNEKE